MTVALWQLLAVGAWAQATIDRSPLQAHADGSPFKISFVGDSITYGALVDPTADSFPVLLQKMLGPKFKTGNFGAVAQTLQKGTGSSYWDTKEFKASQDFAPDAVVIMLGTNDSKGGDVSDGKWAPADKFSDDYQALIGSYQNLPSKPRVWVCLDVPAYGDKAYGIRGSVIENEIVPLLQDIANKAGVPTIDLHKPLLNHPEFFPDDVHPNKEGHLRIAQVIYSYLTGQPLIAPVGSLFSHSIQVTLAPTITGSQVFSTSDGTDPSPSSTAYTAPLSLTQTATVKALAHADSIPADFGPASTTFTEMDPLPAAAAAGATPGLSYAFFKGGNLDNPTGTPDETGEAEGLGKLPHAKDKGCAFVLTGFVTVAKDGVYTFNMASYDTSILFVDEKKVIDDSGSKGLYVAVTGQIALAAGPHALRIIYSQATGNNGLSLRYAGPDLPIQPFPDTGFSHQPPAAP